MGRSRFYEQLRKYMNGKLSPLEKARFDHWLDSLSREGTETPAMTEDDQQKLFDKISNKIKDKNTHISTALPDRRYHPYPPATVSGTGWRWMKVAATVILLLSVSFYLWITYDQARHSNRIVSNANPTGKLILNDGTIVWLSKESQLTYYEHAGDGMRHASLSGEGLFEVTKDPAHPFIIDCKGVTARVVGTSFHLKADEHGVALQVLTGKVHLSSLLDEEGINVSANEKVIYTASGNTTRSAMNEGSVNLITANTDYSMRFSNTGMDQVIDKIERKFDVKLLPTSTAVRQCRITGDFTDQSLDTTLMMISELIDFNYKIVGKTVTVSGTGCK
jgi:transmembrane sensor